MQRIKDIDFIRNNGFVSMHVSIDKDSPYHVLSIVYEVNGQKRNFAPFDYLNLQLENHYIAIDQIKDVVGKYSKSIEAKRDLIHSIQEMRDEIGKFNGLKKEYDFSGILIKADSTVEMLRQKCDNIKLQREINYWQDPRCYWGIVTGIVGSIGILSGVYFAYLKCK